MCSFGSMAKLAFLILSVVADPSIKKSTFDSEIVDILWLGVDREIVILNTGHGTLYRSADRGQSFAEKSLRAGVKVARAIMSPADSTIAVAVGTRLEVFASSDSGNSWHEVTTPEAIRISFMFHPTRPEWALLSAWTADCRLKVPGSPCTHQLLATKDLGRTRLKMVSRHVVQFSWGRGHHSDRIYFTHFRDKSNSQPMLSKWMEGVDFVSTDDMGKSTAVHVEKGNKFVISEQFVLIAKLEDAGKQNVRLMVSKDGTVFRQAIIPTQLAEKSYTILDASEGLVVMHVNHGEGLGNVYVSDESGTRYVLSLQHNVGVNGHAAFEKISNLKGIYFANVWSEDAGAGLPAHFAASWLDHGDYQLGDDSTQSQSEQSIRYLKARPSPTLSQRRLAERPALSVQSVISFNVGGAWSKLKPPSKDSVGNPISCSKNCSLHLHDATFQDHFVPFYSYDKAVGIIMAAGNVGSHLSYNAEDSNTYLSRDGGLTWSEVRKGVYIYEFGNHGAVLVMAAVNSPTDSAIYSLDEGKTWQSVKLDTVLLNVTNILIEPTAVSTEFLAFGSIGGAGVVYRLDFDVLGWQSCKKPSEPSTANSDYESWAPSDGTANRDCQNLVSCGCLLGQQVRYVRRKQMSKCFNRLKERLPVISEVCPCTEEDFECEMDFERALNQRTCVANEMPPPRADFGPMQEHECSQLGYFKVDMYRRVPGDRCIGGWVPPQLDVQCPTRPTRQSHVIGKVAVAAILLAAVIYLARSGRCQEWSDRVSSRTPYIDFSKPSAFGRPTELPEISQRSVVQF
ncbi:unnamed protein product [Effrenium voratum]|nr:unnamed protein product [Effrenium voratum]|mmetsp:Transcript_125423/g.297827  ORF Transcript_125423/g.297827 Transcript_125423/m.297827 type:complete len:792 (+) Transcript_125423:14-2389(+)